MVGINDLLGGSGAAQQLFVYSTLQTIVQALLQPAVVELQQGAMREFTDLDLDPANAAAAVARGRMSQADGADNAAGAGLSPDLFDVLVKIASHGPDLGAVVTAYHRGLIGAGNPDAREVSLRGALAESGIPAEWHDVVVAATVNEPTGAEVLNAYLEGQIERGELERRWKRAGMDPTWLQHAIDSNGEAPTPVQALELLNRGIIAERGTGPDSTSYEQSFLEGPWRNKWLGPFLALREYLPPPRTVTAMVKEGSLTHDEGVRYLVAQGLTPDLAAKYLVSSHTTTTQAQRELTQAQIIQLYRDRLITSDDAIRHLVALRYTRADAELLVHLADAQLQAKQYSAAVTRIRSLYLGGKLTTAQARDALGHAGVPASQVSEVMALWGTEQAATVRTLSPAQVLRAWYYELITYDQAVGLLVAAGYSKLDAYLLVAIENKGKPKGVTRPAGEPS